MSKTGGLAAVGQRIRGLRTDRGMSLSGLASVAGIGKGTLSELEAGTRNPTLETLYALAGPLRVPLAFLLGEVEGAVTSDDALAARLLTVCHHDDGGTTEVYWLTMAAGGTRVSPSHGIGVTEHLLVVRGVVEAGPADAPVRIEAGSSHEWTSDLEHTYTAPEGALEAVLTIRTAASA